MKAQSVPNKRVVVVHWKHKHENPFEVFSSLKNFCMSYTEYNYNTLSNYLSKNKIAYDNADIRIERKNIILKPKQDTTTLIPGRSMVRTIRKIALNKANDTERDIAYWLRQPPAKRIAAVTAIILQSVGSNARMDKTKIVKRKFKP